MTLCKLHSPFLCICSRGESTARSLARSPRSRKNEDSSLLEPHFEYCLCLKSHRCDSASLLRMILQAEAYPWAIEQEHAASASVGPLTKSISDAAQISGTYCSRHALMRDVKGLLKLVTLQYEIELMEL